MLEHKFIQHIKSPTRISTTTSTCLDLIFTNFNNKNNYTTIEELGFSDHSATILHMQIKNTNHSKQIIWYTKKRIFNEDNINKFKSEIGKHKWQDIITTNKTIDENYTNFKNILIKNLNQCIPIQKIKLKTNPKKHWLTKGIKIACKNKRLLKILTTKTNEPILTNYYKQYEKILKKTVRTSKKLLYINKLNKSTNKTKTMWGIINEKTNKTIKREKSNLKLNIDNNTITEPKHIANIFNNFFVSIGENSNPSGTEPMGAPVVCPTENTMFLSPVDGYEVNRIIKNLKNKRSHEINFSKTKLITFHPHQKAPIKLNYSYNNIKLEQVNEFTLLGLTIDTHNRLNLPTSNLKIHSSGPLIMSIKIYNNLPRMLKDETKT
ncbi:hypothetical protein SFRURICE_009165, partial [Spodoptera frugiperda]